MSNFRETPLVLVHGILGFDRLGLPDSPISYFRGIPEALRNAGYMVPEPPALKSAGSVEERANDLQIYLENLKSQKVHLIAHSMGGLDCRYVISKLGMANRVLSLTTLGTPHQGTSIADFDLAALGGLLKALDATRLVDLKGFFDLTQRHFREFAQEGILDSTSVRYFSIAGLYQPGLICLDLLKLSHDLILATEGPNDGLVSVKSASSFGIFLETWPGDHFRLINWPTNLVGTTGDFADHSIIDRYLGLVQHLAEEMP